MTCRINADARTQYLRSRTRIRRQTRLQRTLRRHPGDSLRERVHPAEKRLLGRKHLQRPQERSIVWGGSRLAQLQYSITIVFARARPVIALTTAESATSQIGLLTRLYAGASPRLSFRDSRRASDSLRDVCHHSTRGSQSSPSRFRVPQVGLVPPFAMRRVPRRSAGLRLG